MNKEYFKEQQYIKAKKRVKEIKGFYSHFLIYILVNIFISSIIRVMGCSIFKGYTWIRHC